ncbi:MAG TPA: DUF2961 domain-containing protein [Planctomycetota bacterium]|jgi:hypothetical protein|nr:DUF2961 domain-containing protein [Planctomycetota bacterium]
MEPVRRNSGALAGPLTLLVASCGGGGGGGGGEGGIPPPAGLNPNVGLAVLERFDRLAELPQGERHAHFGGFDLSGGNDDGFTGYDSSTGNRAYLYVDGPEWVIFDVEGAGVVNRLNFALFGGTFTPPKFYVPNVEAFPLNFYFDGESVPRLSLTIEELTAGSTAGFPSPLVGGEAASSGGPFSYFPLPFEHGLRIAMTGVPHFFNIDARLFPTAEGVKTYEPTDDPSEALAVQALVGSDPKPGSEADLVVTGVRTVDPGENHEVASLEGEGTITAIELLPLDGQPVSTLRNLRLRVAYDGEGAPRVDAPIGLLFGTGFAPTPVAGLGFGRRADGTGYLYFPMPFHASAVVSLFNGTAASIPVHTVVRWRPGPYGAPFGYFSAAHTVVDAPVAGEDVVLLDVSGHGRLVGIVTDLTTADPPFGRTILEGDERIYVDGLRTPAVHGTATETFFNWGWYESPVETTFAQPMHGYPHHFETATSDETSCYRLMFGDSIPFEESLRFGFEHGGFNTNEGVYDAVLFYYRKDEPALLQTDDFDPGNPGSEQAHSYSLIPSEAPLALASVFEGTESQVLAEDGYEVGASSSFLATILPANAGVRLVRLSDQGAARQRAQVLVDGVEAGIWYQARSNPFSRWMEDAFEIPAALTSGKSQIAVTILPTGGAPSWNEYRYRVFTHLPPE